MISLFELSNMTNFQNPLSWSITRSTVLYYCQKKYFFSYYGNWLKEFDETIWLETLLLRNLKSLEMWIGEKTHHLISDYLNLVASKSFIDTYKIIEELFKIMDLEYNVSKTRSYKKYDKNNKFWLSEHFYWLDIDNRFELGKEKIVSQFNNFLKSDLHNEIISYLVKPNKWAIEKKEPDFEKMKFIPSDEDSLKKINIWAQPDFWVIVNENIYIIYDWKTWKLPKYTESEISNQLKVYAYKLLLNLWLEKFQEIEIYCYEVYLNEMKIYGWKLILDDIFDIKSKILEDIDFQKTFIVDSDISRNIPMPTHFFIRTHSLKKCETCTFRKVCDELKNYEPEVQENVKTTNQIDKILEEDFPF